MSRVRFSRRALLRDETNAAVHTPNFWMLSDLDAPHYSDVVTGVFDRRILKSALNWEMISDADEIMSLGSNPALIISRYRDLATSLLTPLRCLTASRSAASRDAAVPRIRANWAKREFRSLSRRARWSDLPIRMATRWIVTK